MSTTFWIQFLGIVFGLAMIYFTFVKYKRTELSRKEMSLWFILWLALITIAIYPGFLDSIIAPLNFYRRLDFFVVIGFFTLLFFQFHIYVSQKRNDKKLEEFLRKDALDHPINSPSNQSK